MNKKWILITLVIAIGGWYIWLVAMLTITQIPADIAWQNGAGFWEVFLVRASISLALIPAIEPILVFYGTLVVGAMDNIKEN